MPVTINCTEGRSTFSVIDALSANLVSRVSHHSTPHWSISCFSTGDKKFLACHCSPPCIKLDTGDSLQHSWFRTRKFLYTLTLSIAGSIYNKLRPPTVDWPHCHLRPHYSCPSPPVSTHHHDAPFSLLQLLCVSKVHSNTIFHHHSSLF